jgi:anti-sigma B factor antagonist
MSNAAVPFSVDVEPVRAGVAAVVVKGEIDVSTALEFKHALVGAVRRNDALALIVDLTDVTFIDSSGLNALVQGFENQRRLSGGFAVVSDDSRLTTLLEITRLNRVLRAYPTREEAVAAMWRDS